MPYRWLEDVAIADAAFEAWALTPEELLSECGEAVLETLTGDPAGVRRQVRVELLLEDSPDLVVVRLLESQLWHKDARQLLLHVRPVALVRRPGPDGVLWSLAAELWGEPLDPSRHGGGVDVKAVTLHQLAVSQDPDGTWRARVVLDV